MCIYPRRPRRTVCGRVLTKLLLISSLAVFLLSTAPSHLSAQSDAWQQCQNPLRSMPRDIAVDDDFVYSLHEASIVRAHLNGGGWKVVSTALNNSSIACWYWENSRLTVLLSDGRAAQTTDGGSRWTWSTQVFAQGVKQFVRDNDVLVLIEENGDVVRSSWTQNSTTKIHSLPAIKSLSLIRSAGSAYVATTNAIFRLSDTDTAWTKFCELPVAIGASAELAVFSDTLLVACDSGLYRSYHAGADWHFVEEVKESSSTQVKMRSAYGLVCCVSGARTTQNPGAVFRSNNRGADWYRVDSFRGNAQFATAYQNEVVVLRDDAHVLDVKPIIRDALDLCEIPSDGEVQICAAHESADFVVCSEEAMKRLRGWDIWLPVAHLPMPMNDAIYVNNRLVGCGTGADLFVSDDGGLSWFPFPTKGLPADVPFDRIVREGELVYLSSKSHGIYRSNTGMEQWTQVSTIQEIECWTVRDSVVVIVSSSDARIAVSRDAGANVDYHVHPALSLRSVAIGMNSEIIGVDSASALLFRSTDFGAQFSEQVSQGMPIHPRRLFTHKNYLYMIGNQSGGFFHSVDDGKQWLNHIKGLRGADSLTILRFRDSTLLLGSSASGLYYAYEPLAVSTVNVSEKLNSSSLLGLNLLHLFPNPAKLALEITSFEHQIGDVLTIYDIQGRCLLRQPWSERTTISLSGFSAGLYQVVVQGQLRTSSTHFVVVPD